MLKPNQNLKKKRKKKELNEEKEKSKKKYVIGFLDRNEQKI